jgi:hypothetical protein
VVEMTLVGKNLPSGGGGILALSLDLSSAHELCMHGN